MHSFCPQHLHDPISRLSSLFWKSKFSSQHVVLSDSTHCAGTEYVRTVNTEGARGVRVIMPHMQFFLYFKPINNKMLQYYLTLDNDQHDAHLLHFTIRLL